VYERQLHDEEKIEEIKQERSGLSASICAETDERYQE